MTPVAVGTATPTAAMIVKELEPLGLASIKKVLRNHGAQEPVFGVKIEELKKFQKSIKTNYQLALDLYDTGIYDAMYLAGLVADDARMTKADLITSGRSRRAAISAGSARRSNAGLTPGRGWSVTS